MILLHALIVLSSFAGLSVAAPQAPSDSKDASAAVTNLQPAPAAVSITSPEKAEAPKIVADASVNSGTEIKNAGRSVLQEEKGLLDRIVGALNVDKKNGAEAMPLALGENYDYLLLKLPKKHEQSSAARATDSGQPCLCQPVPTAARLASGFNEGPTSLTVDCLPGRPHESTQWRDSRRFLLPNQQVADSSFMGQPEYLQQYDLGSDYGPPGGSRSHYTSQPGLDPHYGFGSPSYRLGSIPNGSIYGSQPNLLANYGPPSVATFGNPDAYGRYIQSRGERGGPKSYPSNFDSGMGYDLYDIRQIPKSKPKKYHY